MTGVLSVGALTVEEARERMLAAVPAAASESIALDGDAIGRVLAEPVTALRDQPPFDASAMDGWAILTGEGPGVFTIAGESAAGHPFSAAVGPREAVRISTGAAVPAGCRVVIQESAEAVQGGVHLQFSADAPAYVRPRGGDFRAGEAVAGVGVRLDPWRMAVAAAAGRARISVAVRPSVAILPTGEEVIPPGGTPRAGQIFESAGPAVAALARALGARVNLLGPAGDTDGAVLDAIDRAQSPLIVTLGGASVGVHDRVKPALAQRGLVLAVDTVRMRPGKPVWFGRLDDGRLVLGLPGNPASALVCGELFLRPLLMKWQGAAPSLRLDAARLASPLPKEGPREHWMRGALRVDPQGQLTAEAFDDQESSLVSVFARADVLIRRPALAVPARTGDLVEVLHLARL